MYQASLTSNLHLVDSHFVVCVSNMPNMVEAIKTTANALVQVLTLLLQLVVHLLEGSSIEMEESAQTEMSNHLNQMMQELQTHRQVLETLVHHQNNRTKTRTAITVGSPQIPFGMNNPNLHSLNVNPPGRTRSSQASIQGGPPSVLEWDSEDEPFVMEPSGDIVPNTLHVVNQLTSRTTSTAAAVPALPESSSTRGRASRPEIPAVQPQGLSIAEWGQHVISWGKKHKGKRFCDVLKDDLGYYEWSRARYTSLPPDQQDFVRYCQVALEPLSLASGSVDFHQEVMTAKEQLNQFQALTSLSVH